MFGVLYWEFSKVWESQLHPDTLLAKGLAWWSISGRTIKQELEHSVELRPTRPVRTAFEIIDYFKCEISQEILWNYAAKTVKNTRTFV